MFGFVTHTIHVYFIVAIMPPIHSGMPDTVKQVKLRWDSPGGEAAFRHLQDNDLIKQVRRKNANRKTERSGDLYLHATMCF